MLFHRFIVLGFVAALFTVGSNRARADLVFTVTLDTSVLGSFAGTDGPFFLDFELNSPSHGVGTNDATISSLHLGGGSLVGPASATVGTVVSGDLASSLKITTNGTVISSYSQEFSPGTSLSFNLDLTGHPRSPADQFFFQVFSSVSTPPLSILELDITSTTAATVVQKAGGLLSDGQTTTPAPDVFPGHQGAVPEPSTFALVGIGLVGWIGGRWRRKKVPG